jgi:hypothetical protein
MKFGIKMVIICIVFIFAANYFVPSIDKQQTSITIEEPNPYIPCQNLDALDSVQEIIHWEIWDDTLHIYTKQDSARDEQERIKYIMSLEEDWDWEEEFERELKNEN